MYSAGWLLDLWQAVRDEQSKDNGLATEGQQGGKPWVPINGQNWENKDLIPRVTFPPLAYHWSYELNPLTFHIAGHSVWPLPWLFLTWHAAGHEG